MLVSLLRRSAGDARRVLSLTIVACFLGLLGPATVQAQTTIQHDEFTFRSNLTLPSGTFVNGDPWIAVPLGVEIQVTYTTPSGNGPGRIGGRYVNGWAINPRGNINNVQSFDSAMNTRYFSFTEPRSVIRMRAGDSLVASWTDRRAPGAKPAIERAAILTAIPPVAAIWAPALLRPSYCGDVLDKAWAFVWDIRFDMWRDLPRVSGEPFNGDADVLATQIARPWLDNQANWTSQYLHPVEAWPGGVGYGRDMASRLGECYLMLHSDRTLQEKWKLAIAVYQQAMDTAGILNNGGRFNYASPNGGHLQGRAMLALLAQFGLRQPVNVNYSPSMFGNENGQTFYVPQSLVGQSLRPHSSDQPITRYGNADVGMPEWGIAFSTRQNASNRSWEGATYRQCCTANSWHSHALAARLCGLRQAWGHPAFFEYTVRFMEIQLRRGRGWERSWSQYAARVWDTYAGSYDLAPNPQWDPRGWMQ